MTTNRVRTLMSALFLAGLAVVSSPMVGRLSAQAGTSQPQNASEPAGAVFAMTNATEGNEIVVYRRAADGTLRRRTRAISTRGLGIGVDTDTQGPLRLSADHRFLYAVNPGSDNITVFEVQGTSLKFLQLIDAGDQPLSLTISGELLYVLNGSVAGNGIRGFRIARDGTLRRLRDSFRELSSPIAVPGEVSFSPDGQFLLVTHKTTNVLLTPTNAIDVFTVDTNGYASAAPKRNESFGLRPFSLAFRHDGLLAVVESFNAAPDKSAVSSYYLQSGDTLAVVSGSVPNGQTDVCWIVITANGQYTFVANFGSGTISSYRIESSGSLVLLNARAASLGAMSQPVDLSFSADGRYLYQLLRGTGAVAAFRVDDAGVLTPLGVEGGGLPVADGVSGLASF